MKPPSARNGDGRNEIAQIASRFQLFAIFSSNLSRVAASIVPSENASSGLTRNRHARNEIAQIASRFQLLAIFSSNLSRVAESIVPSANASSTAPADVSPPAPCQKINRLQQVRMTTYWIGLKDIYIYIYTHICMYIHTHTHIYI